MPEYLWDIGFAVSLIFAVSVAVLIARRIFKAGVEHFSGRILIISSIINSFLCGFLFLLQGGTELYRISISPSFHLGQLVVPCVFLIVPCKIIWNYFLIQKKLIARYNLIPHNSDGCKSTLTSLSKTMGISMPTAMSSELVFLPFVFGLRSNRAILAVPKNWQNIDNKQQRILLFHELGHILNHDVGFFAWSNACIHDVKFLLIVLPALVIYCGLLGFTSLISSITAYLACLVILLIMLRYVGRKREILADMTAAMLIESGRVCDVISQHQPFPSNQKTRTGRQTKPTLSDKIRRWLTDKALFSSRKKLWDLLLRVFSFFYLQHPTMSERVKAISSQNTDTQQSNSSLNDSFWAGITLGLFGVVIGLTGYWFGIFMQTPQENMGIVRLPYKLYGLMSPLGFGFLPLFLALPVWSSSQPPILNKQFLLSLAARYGLAFAGACLIAPIILTAGAANLYIQILFVTCLIWCVSVVFFGFLINVSVIFLWITIRHSQSSKMLEAKKALGKFSSFIIAMIVLLSIAGWLLSQDRVFDAANMSCSIVIGTALTLKCIYSRFSETDQYIISRICFRICRFEGRLFKKHLWFMGSFFITVLLLLFTFLVFGLSHLTLNERLQNTSPVICIPVTIVICCAVLVFVEFGVPKRITETRRQKIHKLFHCSQLLGKPFRCENSQKLDKVIESYDLGMTSTRVHTLDLTINDVFELVSFLPEDPTQSKALDHVSKWVLRCQTETGFGLWPGSSPRLCSTYQAISILRDVNLLNQCNIDPHTSWIKTLQQSDGSFKGPYSKRDPWQDTFHATRSLNMLGASLEDCQAQLCQAWCSHALIEKGLKENRPDIIYYCFGALTVLGKVDDDLSELISDWLSAKIEALLLTNVSLDYESVHFTLMTYSLFGKAVDISEDSLDLLAERVQTALNAELADIRIYAHND